MADEQDTLPRCEECNEESAELLPCDDCGLTLCPTCIGAHDCDEDL